MSHNSSAQGGEDLILKTIFKVIGTTNRVCVEFGATDGTHGSNTLLFRRNGWKGYLFDTLPLGKGVIQAHLTVDNINEVFCQYGVPAKFDLLSVDVDGNDFWLWQALTRRPRVVVIEFNPKWSPRRSRVVPYDPDRFWDGSDYYGASVLALCRLGKEKGYHLVAYTRSNLIFVLSGLVGRIFPHDVHRRKKRKRVDDLNRPWVEY